MRYAGLNFRQVDKHRGHRIMTAQGYRGVIILKQYSRESQWTSARDVLHAFKIIDEAKAELESKLNN